MFHCHVAEETFVSRPEAMAWERFYKTGPDRDELGKLV